MAKGAIITEKVFSSIMILHEANPELNNKQIGAAFKVDESTVGKMIRCGTWEKYGEFKKEKAEKGRQRKMARKTKEEKPAEDQLKGQMKMDLKQVEEPKMEMSEQTKMMRFMAGQVDKMIMQMNFISEKLEKLNDTVSMVLRAVRKE